MVGTMIDRLLGGSTLDGRWATDAVLHNQGVFRTSELQLFILQ